MRVAVLFNDDAALAHGEAIDGLAARGAGEEAAAVAAACRRNGWTPVDVPVTRDLSASLAALREAKPDVVFFLVEAVGGEARFEAAAAWTLEWTGLPYTGSPPQALALALDKPLTRVLLESRGIPVPFGALLERGDEPLRGLRWPCIVKPSREDASHGITAESVVADDAAARARARDVFETYRQPALVEEFVDGRELNAAILGTGDGAETLPFSEIDFSAFDAGRPRLVTYDGKWVAGSHDYERTKPFFPDDLGPQLAARVRAVALAAYRAVGVRDYGRVDLRVHREAGPLVLEVNPNPDVSPDAGMARAAAKAGIEYPRLVRRIVEAALARAARPTPPPPR